MSDQRTVIPIDFSEAPKKTASLFMRAAFPDRVDLWDSTQETLTLINRFDDEVWTPIFHILRKVDCSMETKESIFHAVRLEAWNQIADLLAPERVEFTIAPTSSAEFDD